MLPKVTGTQVSFHLFLYYGLSFSPKFPSESEMVTTIQFQYHIHIPSIRKN